VDDGIDCLKLGVETNEARNDASDTGLLFDGNMANRDHGWRRKF
jgi:hypothetical protein